MRKSVIYGIVMAVSLLCLLVIPFMPYLHMDLMTAYVGKDSMSAVELVRQMHVLYEMPGSTNIFGHEHYEEITLALTILGIVLIALPILLGLLSMVLTLGGKSKKARGIGAGLSVVMVLIFVACLAAFTLAGYVITAETRAGYGVYFGLGASLLFAIAAFCCKSSKRNAAAKRKTTAHRSSARVEESGTRTRRSGTGRAHARRSEPRRADTSRADARRARREENR